MPGGRKVEATFDFTHFDLERRRDRNDDFWVSEGPERGSERRPSPYGGAACVKTLWETAGRPFLVILDHLGPFENLAQNAIFGPDRENS